jgi:hypothetical protein
MTAPVPLAPYLYRPGARSAGTGCGMISSVHVAGEEPSSLPPFTVWGGYPGDAAAVHGHDAEASHRG